MAVVQTELIRILNTELNTELPGDISEENLLKQLAELINHLIQNNFQKLVIILYRIDVSETKLKQLLEQDSNEDAAVIISKLIIEREIQKINSRNLFMHNNDICDEEKW
jgi:hypothetical protein